MTNIVPGAIWQPIVVDVPSANIRRTDRRKGRGVAAHVAVSEAARLVPPSPTDPRPRGADWHWYLPREATPQGRFYQFIDLDRTCWATGYGNPSMAAWEAQGGVHDADGEPWSENQMEAGAIILAYMNETEDVPLRLMLNSRPEERGLGYHKLGIDPWRVPGGELWSSSRGKICPGLAKIAGLPAMLDRAIQIRGGSPSPNPAPAPPPPPAQQYAPPRMNWPFPAGHYVGDRKGPAASHGGYYAGERAFVQNVQQWFIYHGCVPGQTNWRSGWADGLFDAPYSTQAARTWHERFYPGQPYPEQIWRDDYDRLARP